METQGNVQNKLEDVIKKIEEINKQEVCENQEEIEAIYLEIAKDLMTKFCIKKGNDVFYFLEIEIYYKSQYHDEKTVDEKSFVYERYCDKYGQFFLNPSGVDISFKGMSHDDLHDVYGGILLRTLLLRKDGKNYVVTGPFSCADTLFNYSDADNYPHIEEIIESDFLFKEEKIMPCRRYNDNIISNLKST